MIKSKWVELLEWCILAMIVAFVAGVFLTGSGDDEGTQDAPRVHIDE
jgi:hypothetical protein